MKIDMRLPFRAKKNRGSRYLNDCLPSAPPELGGPASTAVSLRVIDSGERLHAAEKPWNELFGRLRPGNLFLSWDWMSAWWETYRREGMRLKIIVLTDGERYLGIAPFYVQNKVLRFLGTGEGEHEEVSPEYLDLICQPQAAELFSSRLCAWLQRHHKRWHLIEIPNVLDDSMLSRHTLPRLNAAGYRVATQFAGLRYTIDLPASWDDYLKCKKPKFRTNIRSRLKKLVLRSDYSMQDLSSLGVERAMALLKALHEKRWHQKQKTGAFSSPRFVAFHTRLVRKLVGSPGVEINVMFLGDKPLAAIYNFGVDGVRHYYQSGFDPDYAGTYGAGRVSLVLAIQRAIEDPDVTQFDLMIGSEDSYKREYATATASAHHILVFNNTSSARFLHGKQMLKAMLRREGQ